MFYGSNLYRKDKPRWLISNSTETLRATEAGFRLAAPRTGWEQAVAGRDGRPGRPGWPGWPGLPGRVRSACGLIVSWLIGLPRRTGAWLHVANDDEARWWGWLVTERCGGLVHQYRDPRFEALSHDPAVRRAGLGAELTEAEPAPPDCSCGGDR